MKTRCYNERCTGFDRWGGRGIIVCEGWKNDFLAFYEDMGEKPAPKELYSIGRKDNNSNYSCGKCDQCIKSGWEGNCSWENSNEQASNTENNIDTASKYVGVFSRSEGVWYAKIQIRKVLYRLGTFYVELDAAKAYDDKYEENYGYRLNGTFRDGREIEKK